MAIREYHAPKILAAVFLLIVLVGGYFLYDWKNQKTQIQAQEVQAVAKCQDQFRNQAEEGEQVSFQEISAERFGAAHIIVRGTAVYARESGQARTQKMNCNIDVPASGR